MNLSYFSTPRLFLLSPFHPVSVLSDSQHCSGHPFIARISYIIGFELQCLGSWVGRTYLRKTYSGWLTRDFLEDENHVSLGLLTSVWVFSYVQGLLLFWRLQRESRNICAIQTPSKKRSQEFIYWAGAVRLGLQPCEVFVGQHAESLPIFCLVLLFILAFLSAFKTVFLDFGGFNQVLSLLSNPSLLHQELEQRLLDLYTFNWFLFSPVPSRVQASPLHFI